MKLFILQQQYYTLPEYLKIWVEVKQKKNTHHNTQKQKKRVEKVDKSGEGRWKGISYAIKKTEWTCPLI